jgi:hypothetical protein
MRQKSAPTKEPAEEVIKGIRRATRRRFSRDQCLRPNNQHGLEDRGVPRSVNFHEHMKAKRTVHRNRRSVPSGAAMTSHAPRGDVPSPSD